MRVIISIVLGLMIALASPAQNSSVSIQESSNKVEQKQSDAKEQIIRCFTEIRVIPVIASRQNGSYIEDLTHQELQVFEDGVKEILQFFSRGEISYHIVLVFDTWAASAEKLQQMKSAAIAFVEKLRPTDRIKVIAFDESIHELCDFTDDRSVLRDVIASIKLGHSNKLYDAIHEAITAIKNTQGISRAIVVLKSDTTKDTSSYSDDYTLYELSQAPVPFYSVCYGVKNNSSLVPFAKRTGGQAFVVNTPSLLADAFAKITRDLFAVCWLGYSPFNTKRDGIYRKIEVQSTRKDIMLRTPSGYFAPDDRKAN